MDLRKELDLEIERTRGRLAGLIEVRALLEKCDGFLEVVRRFDTPAAAASDGRSHPRRADQRRLAAAEYLASVGTAGPAEITRNCGVPQGSVGYFLKGHPWFEHAAEGWRLTDAGRAALREETQNAQ